MGLKYPTLLALSGAVVWLIPLVGVILVVIPALLVGLMNSLTLGVLAAFYTFIVLLVLEMVIEPRLIKHRHLISPLLVVLVMMVLADAFGILGLVMAPPLAGAIQIFLGNLVQRSPPGSIKPAPQVTDLYERLTAINATIAEIDEPPSPEVINIMERLTRLMEKASQAL